MDIQIFRRSKLLLALFVFSLLGALVTFTFAIEPGARSQLKLQDFIFVAFSGIGAISLYLIFAVDVCRDDRKGYLRKLMSMIVPTAGLVFAVFVLTRTLGIV